MLEKSEHAIDIAHRDDSYLLFILKGGSGRVLIDSEEFQFTGPAFCLIRPEQVHSLVEYNTPEGSQNPDQAVIEQLNAQLKNAVGKGIVYVGGDSRLCVTLNRYFRHSLQ